MLRNKSTYLWGAVLLDLWLLKSLTSKICPLNATLLVMFSQQESSSITSYWDALSFRERNTTKFWLKIGNAKLILRRKSMELLIQRHLICWLRCCKRIAKDVFQHNRPLVILSSLARWILSSTATVFLKNSPIQMNTEPRCCL